MTDTVSVLPPIVITGERPLDGARQTTTTVRLDRARLSRFLPGTANEALVLVPGVDLVKTGPWASRVSLRGLGGDRVLLMVDGVRMNGVRGHGSQASLVPVDRLDAIEVQPGAGGAQFGSDALSGVVNFSTHRSLFDSRAGAQLTIQSRGSAPDDGWGASSRLRVFGPRGGFELAGGAGGLGALVTPDGREPHSGFRERNLGGRVALQMGGTLLDYEHTWSGAYDVGLPAFGDTLGSHGSYPVQSRQLDRLELFGAGTAGRPDARLLASLQTGRSDFEETTVSPRFINGRLRGYNVIDAWDRVRNRAVSLQPSLHWPQAAGLRLAGEFRREASSGPRTTVTTTKTTTGVVSNTATGQGESLPHAERRAWSASTLVAPAWNAFRLELGGRYDHYFSRADSTSISSTPELSVADGRWSADGGLSYTIGEIEPYLHFASGFRVPNLEERYYHDEIHGGMVVFGNPRLASERSRSSELGLRVGEFGLMRNARLSAYRSDVEDLITIRYLDMLFGRPQFQYANVKRARIEGLEAQGQLIAHRVALGLYGTLPRAREISTGMKLTDPGTARAAFDLSVPVPRMVPNGQLALRVRWNDAITGVDSTLARPAFSTSAIELSSVWAGIRASVAVRNLWNHRYREPLSFIAEPGRSVAFSLRRDLAIGIPFLHRKGR
ncbi:MAG: TonB-dependent receptor [Candidatus Eisenbacteria bacterium]